MTKNDPRKTHITYVNGIYERWFSFERDEQSEQATQSMRWWRHVLCKIVFDQHSLQLWSDITFVSDVGPRVKITTNQQFPRKSHDLIQQAFKLTTYTVRTELWISVDDELQPNSIC